ncbi:hypothetical protein IJG28_00750 [Candidatus Saccharibacteria bacterium]|nr:hypothetical protein [Candidatus Saccharibacteria bacterium]
MSDYETYQLLNSLSSSSSSSSAVHTAEGIGVWGIVALILSIVGAILVYFLFVKSKTDPKGKFVKWLKDFLSFKVMWIETILKITYYFATIFVMLFSFSYLALGGFGVLMFFMSLILGPIVVRLIYEASIMFVMIWRNTRDIADNTVKKK